METHLNIWKTLVDNPGNNSKIIKIMILNTNTFMRFKFSVFFLDVHIRAQAKAAKTVTPHSTGTIKCNVNRSKKRTFILQLVEANKDIKSKLKTFMGKAMCKTMSGHGTLSNTLGKLENI